MNKSDIEAIVQLHQQVKGMIDLNEQLLTTLNKTRMEIVKILPATYRLEPSDCSVGLKRLDGTLEEIKLYIENDTHYSVNGDEQVVDNSRDWNSSVVAHIRRITVIDGD